MDEPPPTVPVSRPDRPGPADRRDAVARAGAAARAAAASIAAMAVVTVPLVVAAGLLPPPLSWIGWWLALTLGMAGGLAAAVGADPRRGIALVARRWRTLVGAGLVAFGGIGAVVIPTILVVSALSLGAFGAYLVVLAAFWIAARFVLVVPAIVVEGLGVLDAVDRAWDLAEGAVVELGAVAAGGAALLAAPVVIAAAVGGALGLPEPAVLVGAGLGCSLTGPAVAVAGARLLGPYEGRRRATDPAHGHP